MSFEAFKQKIFKRTIKKGFRFFQLFCKYSSSVMPVSDGVDVGGKRNSIFFNLLSLAWLGHPQ
jgi:hypothetical protein